MIPDITPVNTWAGNGSTTTFDFDFLINNDSELQVLHTSKDGFQTELKLNRDYTINQVGNENGSYITFPILGSSYKVLGEDEKISLVLNIPIAQSSPYGTSSKLNLKALEHSLDYIVRLIQIESRKNDRAVKVQEGSGISPEELIDSLRQSEINARDYAQTTIDKAQEAKDSADFAKAQADIATAKTKEVEDAYEGAIVDITQRHNAAIDEIDELHKSSISDINTTCQTSLNEIAEAKKGAIDSVNTTKTTAQNEAIKAVQDECTTSLTTIDTAKKNAKSELEAEVVKHKNNIQTFVDNVCDTAKTNAESEITSVKNTSLSEIKTAKNNSLNEINSQAETLLANCLDRDMNNLSSVGENAIQEIVDYPNLVTKNELTEVASLKGDGLLYEDGLLYLTSGGEKVSTGIEVAAGSGGGGGGGYAVSFTLTTITESYIYKAFGETVNLSYTYTSEQNEPATVQYYVNSELKATARITKNDNITYDCTKYLKEGYNRIQVKVTDAYGGARSLFYTINTISLKLTSNFDSSIPYSAPIDFRYTPTGDAEKTIHFLIDGVETTEIVKTSGRQQSKRLTFEHGVHTLKVWATAIVEETEITSNVLYYEIMYITGDGTVITSEFSQTDFTQGDIVTIDYNVYNASSLTCPVQIYVNNVLVSDLVVDRKRQTWSKAINEYGEVEIKIVSNEVEKIFKLNVAKVETTVEAVTENLELFLTANGKSNSDITKNEWKFNDISCVLSGFNWITNGWLNNALKISGGARLTIPKKIFASDFRTNGKTIEFEFSTSNVADYDSVLIDCREESTGRGFRVGVQKAVLKSEQSEVSVKFKEDEHVRLTFVIEPRSANRLIYTYINGILSGLAQYPDDDDFSQINPLEISIGSDTCDIDIYNIRVYDSYLTEHDVLNNYIADTADTVEKLNRFTRNDIYDSYGKVVYSKILNQLPIMVITGDLPTAKGDKKVVSVRYEDVTDPSKNFTMDNITIDVQGTSSQYYPKKNYKISKLPEAYKLRDNSVPEKKFTLKADYMESSHAYNTGLAKFVNDLYETKTPPQKDNDNIRTTIDGFPIAIFYKTDADAEMKYFGVYNFNNDKSNADTFGFTDGCESWEVTNNTSDRCLFKSDDFSDKAAMLTDFEARYPEDYTDTTQLERLIKWVVLCDTEKATGSDITPVTIDGVSYTKDTADYRLAKFKNEINDYFNKDFLLTYYIISEFFGMVDSRAKNMFLNTYGNGIWYPVFYDLDTCIGLNNEGVNNFNFDIEYHDVIGTEGVFNGEKSALWNLVEKAYQTEIEDLYNTYRNSGALSYDRAMQYLYESQIAKICEAQYNEDANFKYLSPLLEDNIATYLYTAQGSRIDHIKWWLYNRFKYMDSKYIAADFRSNYLTMRLYTPTSWQDVEPNAEITVTPYIDQYVRIKYGAYDVGVRATHDNPVKITPPNIKFNDTETILYGADKITSIGSLAPLYAGTIDVSKAVKLSELIIGAGGNYRNTNLKSLTLGNNVLLNKLDIRNCSSLSGALDVSGCTNLRELYAEGTALNSVKLAEAGTIKILHLPDTISNLTMKNQNSIEDFSCGYAMTTLVIENCNIDSLSILNNSSPNKVRITGIDWSLEDFSLLDRVYNLTGVDENGYNIEHGVIAGTIRMSNVKESVINEYKKKFVGINFVVDNYADEDVIRTDGGIVVTTNDGKALLMTGV